MAPTFWKCLDIAWWRWILLLFPCGAYKGSALVFVIILYLDYSRALILLAYFKAYLFSACLSPFSAIPHAAAGVFLRLRESTWTTRNVGFFSFCNFNLNVCAAHRLGSQEKTISLAENVARMNRENKSLETEKERKTVLSLTRTTIFFFSFGCTHYAVILRRIRTSLCHFQHGQSRSPCKGIKRQRKERCKCSRKGSFPWKCLQKERPEGLRLARCRKIRKLLWLSYKTNFFRNGLIVPEVTLHQTLLTYFITTPPYRGWQRSEGLLLLHSFLSLDIFVAFSIVRLVRLRKAYRG